MHTVHPEQNQGPVTVNMRQHLEQQTQSYYYEIRDDSSQTKFLQQNKEAHLSMKQQNNTFGCKCQNAAKQTFELLNCSGRGHSKGPCGDTPTPPSNRR